jgi:hypothetical protein
VLKKTPKKPLSSNALARAKARYRERQRLGVVVAHVPYNAPVLELLIQTRWLAERDAGDRLAVGLAIGKGLLGLAREKGLA